ARRQEPEPTALSDLEPNPVPVFDQQPLQPQPFVEALETLDVVGLQDQLADPGDGHAPGFPFPSWFKPSRSEASSRAVIELESRSCVSARGGASCSRYPRE